MDGPEMAGHSGRDAFLQQNDLTPILRLRPGREEFEALEGYDAAMVWAEVSSDLETPVSAFMKLRDGGPCFMLESAEGGTLGRYSFLGFEPGTLVSLAGGELRLDGPRSGSGPRAPGEYPLRAFFDMVEGTRALVPGDMPFAGGAVGYFGYGILPLVESVRLTAPGGTAPDMAFMFPERLVMFDHLRSRMRLCALADAGGSPEDRAVAYRRAGAAIREMSESLARPLPDGGGIRLEEDDPGASAAETFECSVPGGRFEEMVSDALEYIRAGDAFQVVVSRRFSAGFDADPLSVYRHLRAGNPSPYMFYLELPGLTLVGSSPEPMVTRRGGTATVRPIAGTRPRGSDRVEDSRLEAELKADAKERAEHVMLVDLARNDLGRVSVPGTVRVTRMMEVERFSHVMHMVSEVEGRLEEGRGNYELLKATFPAGTVVGAPKVRAAQIIDELEPDARGPYAGAVGYVSYSGDMDTCIAIRTVTVQDGVASVQAGAGVVADSDPAGERRETESKAGALTRAIRLAEAARSDERRAHGRTPGGTDR